MKNIYLILLSLLILASCGKKLTVSKVDEPFDVFYDEFHSDQSFQMSRVQFPLEGKYVSIDGSESWSKEDWEPHVQKVTDISDPDYDTEIIRSDDEVTDKVWLKESGFSVERRFEKIKGKWYLVYYETIDL